MSTLEPDPTDAANQDIGAQDREQAVIEVRSKSTLGEIWDFLKVRKRFWLAPIIIALMLLGGLILFAGSAGVVAPFVYMM